MKWYVYVDFDCANKVRRAGPFNTRAAAIKRGLSWVADIYHDSIRERLKNHDSYGDAEMGFWVGTRPPRYFL